MDQRRELLELYKLAYAEYRAEVRLGWERQRFFLLSSLGSTVVLVSLDGCEASIFTVIAAFAVTGALVVRRSHERYRATMFQVRALEDRLEVAGVQTTGGQRAARGATRDTRLNVVDLVTLLLMLIAAFDVFLNISR